MALIYHLDASNPASWANAGTNPENWTDISGALAPPGGTPASAFPIEVQNLPTLITDGAVKGLRMVSQSGGTYPNGSAILQSGQVYVGTGNPSAGTQLGNLWWGGSYSVQMWIKFNQAPIGGSSNATDRLPTIIWSSVVSGNGPVIIFGANLADTLRPRANDARIGVQWGAPDVTPLYVATGDWSPVVDTWYMATIVCNRSSSTTGTLSLYINDTQSGTSVSYTSTTSPMFEWMGSGGSFTGYMTLNCAYSTAASPGYRYFGGDITFSTFKIFNTALSSVDIALQFNDEAPAFGIPTMSTIAVNPPYPTFTDRNGDPLENGYIYIGLPNLDPQSNPVATFYDEALTIPAVQPIRTINGYASNAGTPARLFIDGTNYSIRVLDQKGSMIVNSEVQPTPALFTILSASTSITSPIGNFNSITATTGAITTLTGTTATFSDVNGTTVDATTATATTGNITTVNATTVNTATLNVTGNTQLGNSTSADTISVNARIGLNRAAAADYLIYGKTQTSAAGDYAWRFQNASSNNLGFLESDGTFNTGLEPLSPRNYTTTSTSDYCVIDANGTLRRSTSSARYKANIRDNLHGLDEVLNLRAVLYEDKREPSETNGGLIAEEVHAIGLSEFVSYDDQGRPDNVSYSGLVSLLAKAIQQQQAIIEQQRADIDAAASLIDALTVSLQAHQEALQTLVDRVAALESAV